MIKHDPIYKLDSKGKTRVWYMERAEAAHRTVAGILGGNLVTSEWTFCTGKQGRSDEAQAHFEVEAAYANKLAREYHRSLDDVANGAHFFKPMLAEKFTGFPGYCHAQPKLDGARCIATRKGLFSRQGKPFVSVPHIMEALEPIFAQNPDVILDGELYNHELKDDFNTIMSLIRQQKPTDADLRRSEEMIQYHVYDMPSHPGNFCNRTHAVSRMLTGRLGIPDCLKAVETRWITDAEELDTFHMLVMNDGYEGSIVRLDTPYEQKRTKNLLKRKEFETEEFKLLSIDEGQGNWSGVAKSVTCELEDGRTFSAGIRGDRRRAADLLHETWSEVTVRFFKRTPDGIPRFPVGIAVRDEGIQG